MMLKLVLLILVEVGQRDVGGPPLLREAGARRSAPLPEGRFLLALRRRRFLVAGILVFSSSKLGEEIERGRALGARVDLLAPQCRLDA